MKRGLVVLLLLVFSSAAWAHALDDYIQAALVAVTKTRVEVSMRLAPGVAVLPGIVARIDSDKDGVLSPAEGQAYARQMLADVTLRIDGTVLTPSLLSVQLPAPAALKDGLGEIRIAYAADLPAGGGNRTLVIRNRHLPDISSYLVNSLVPRDPDIRLLAQRRNADQSFYTLDYSQGGGATEAAAIDAGGFGPMFRLGLHHIAQGTDHLLFLLTLLLPAPLLVRGARWAGAAPVRHSLAQIALVVTAFTLGHSLTLALAGLGLVRVPAALVEILIAFSILVSAIHALRPVFPGREAAIAGVFGLIHGLAFATLLGRLGLGPWERTVNLLGFNLGIEAMQLVVVAATLPSLLLLRRTAAYAWLRIGGALFAGAAALCWIAERLLGWQTPVDQVVSRLAGQAAPLAAILFLAALAALAAQTFRPSAP